MIALEHYTIYSSPRFNDRGFYTNFAVYRLMIGSGRALQALYMEIEKGQETWPVHVLALEEKLEYVGFDFDIYPWY